MKISVLDIGVIGDTLGTKLVQLGYEVQIRFTVRQEG